MNDTIRMQISAFIDGELPDNESELLLRRLSQDAELRRVVARYMEIGRNMRHEGELPKMAQLRHRIAEELGAEPRTEEIMSTRLGNRYFKPLAGIAVAASVAIIAIVGLQQTNAPTADAEAVADSSTYTQLPADSQLDEMFRLHDASGSVGSNSMLTEFVTLEINEEDLVKVEPNTELVVPSESDDEEDDEAIVTETGEADLQAN